MEIVLIYVSQLSLLNVLLNQYASLRIGYFTEPDSLLPFRRSRFAAGRFVAETLRRKDVLSAAFENRITCTRLYNSSLVIV